NSQSACWFCGRGGEPTPTPVGERTCALAIFGSRLQKLTVKENGYTAFFQGESREIGNKGQQHQRQTMEGSNRDNETKQQTTELLRQGAGSYPSGHRAEGRIHPGQVASPSQGRQTDTDSHSHLGAM
ncbi:hypothetical protein SRHO_G00205700, partial [Serrasalmus rhombeus]